ncbi:hypothetical protein B0F90DRAFT_321501 [Multifurca ochricompacta]|uniref:Uncharacterized protein n=1 Tax=Multifurca ochricompacta TaxID=376703 RepID=A0AAD4M5V2_9AGAM|nr:hypothetical protein B0F90DRAFT_321501 [Multifurca ochricompacta]
MSRSRTRNLAQQPHTNTNHVNPIPSLPSRPGRILLGSAAILGATFGGVWYYMIIKQSRKASREPGERGALPSWEYRILQAVNPVRDAGSSTTHQNARDASTVEPRTEPRTLPLDMPNSEPGRSQHHTFASGGTALCKENGAMMHPVPERGRGDDLVNAKKHPPYKD